MESVHPLIVHFPIVWLLTALALETVGVVTRRESWRGLASWCLAMGTVAAGVTVLTGRLAARVAKHSWEIAQVLERHERMGYLVFWLAVATIGWRVATRGRPAQRRPVVRWIGWGLLAATCGGLVVGAHLGGRLVYEYGVGGVYGRSAGDIQVAPE